MAVKWDARRQRYASEFQQGGIRVFRRMPKGITKAQAEEWEVKKRRALFDVGPLGNKPEITLPAAIQLWLENNHRKNQKQAESEAKQWAPFVEGKLLRDAPETAAEAVRAWSTVHMSAASLARTDKRCKASTVNRRLCILKAAAKYAWKQGWIDQNVSGRITLLPERNAREVYLTKTQVRALALAASGPTRAAIWIAAYTGLRASEILAITSEDLTRGTLRVRQSKTGRPRIVPAPSACSSSLSELPLSLSYWQLHKQFLAAAKKAGMPHVHFHDLRHTAASWLANAGVDQFVVGRILGHSSPQSTARYSHLFDKTLRKAMARLK